MGAQCEAHRDVILHHLLTDGPAYKVKTRFGRQNGGMRVRLHFKDTDLWTEKA